MAFFGLRIMRSEMPSTLPSVNTHDHRDLGMSASNPVSLNPLTNCRTALRVIREILETLPQTSLASSVHSRL
jgi:hypothetical protein